MRNRRARLAWGAPLLGLLVYCTTVIDDGKVWSPAERIDEQSDAFALQVALDASGTATVVSDSATLAAGAIFSRHSTPGGGWDAVAQIDPNEEDAHFPSLAVDPNGNAAVAWIQKGAARLSIWSNRYTTGSGWAAAVRLDTEDAGDATDPHVAIDPDGSVVAVWHQSGGELENIWASRSTPGDGWGTAELIENNDDGHAGDPRVAVDPEGNAIAVWHQSDGARANIWANRYTPGDGWGTARRIEINDRGEARLPRLAMDLDGNAVVVWHQSDGTRFDIWSTRFTPADGWDTVVRIDGDDTGDANGAEVGLDAGGNAIAVWRQFDGINVGIWTNRYTPGDGWDTATRIDSTGAGDALSPHVAVSANGDAVAVWLQSNGSRMDTWSNSYTQSEGWNTAVPVDPINEAQGQPHAATVAIDPNGNAVAVWTRVPPPFAFGGGGTIWSARFE